MKRYVIGFWGAYLLSVAASVGMFFLTVANWLFTKSPLWFDMLFLIVILLPFLALGDRLSRKGMVRRKPRLLALLIHIAVQIGLAFLGNFLMGESVLQILVWPGTLPGSLLRETLDYNGYWGELFPVMGHILLPVLYHFGWLMGKPSEKE